MPNCKFQLIAAAGFQIQTNEYGLLEVSVATVGNITTVTCRKDGALQQEPTINNATPSVLQTVITNFLNGIVVGVQNAPPHIQIVCTVSQVNPFVFGLRSANPGVVL